MSFMGYGKFTMLCYFVCPYGSFHLYTKCLELERHVKPIHRQHMMPYPSALEIILLCKRYPSLLSFT